MNIKKTSTAIISLGICTATAVAVQSYQGASFNPDAFSDALNLEKNQIVFPENDSYSKGDEGSDESDLWEQDQNSQEKLNHSDMPGASVLFQTDGKTSDAQDDGNKGATGENDANGDNHVIAGDDNKTDGPVIKVPSKGDNTDNGQGNGNNSNNQNNDGGNKDDDQSNGGTGNNGETGNNDDGGNGDNGNGDNNDKPEDNTNGDDKKDDPDDDKKDEPTDDKKKPTENNDTSGGDWNVPGYGNEEYPDDGIEDVTSYSLIVRTADQKQGYTFDPTAYHFYYGDTITPEKVLASSYVYIKINDAKMYRIYEYGNNFRYKGVEPNYTIATENFYAIFEYRANENTDWKEYKVSFSNEKYPYVVNDYKMMMWDGKSPNFNKIEYILEGQKFDLYHYYEDLDKLQNGNDGKYLDNMCLGFATYIDEEIGDRVPDNINLEGLGGKGKYAFASLGQAKVPEGYKVSMTKNIEVGSKVQTLVDCTLIDRTMSIPEGIMWINFANNEINVDKMIIPSSTSLVNLKNVVVENSFEVDDNSLYLSTDGQLLMDREQTKIFGLVHSLSKVEIPQTIKQVEIPKDNKITELYFSSEEVPNVNLENLVNTRIYVPTAFYEDYLSAWRLRLGTNTLCTDKDIVEKNGVLYTHDGTVLHKVLASAKGTVIIDEKVKVIEAGALDGCDAITTLVFKGNIETIEAQSLSGSKVEEIVFLGDNVPKLSPDTFTIGDSTLDDIRIKVEPVLRNQYLTDWGEVITTDLSEKTAEDIIVANEKAWKEMDGFVVGIENGSYSLVKAPVETEVFEIEDFENLYGISLTRVEQYAFSDCINLYAATIPESVTTIDQYAFEGCNKLQGLVCKASDSIYIDTDMLYGCNNVRFVALDAHNIDFEDNKFNVPAVCEVYFSGEVTDEWYDYVRRANCKLPETYCIEILEKNAILCGYENSDAVALDIVKASVDLIAPVVEFDVNRVLTDAFYDCQIMTQITFAHVNKFLPKPFTNCDSLEEMVLEQPVDNEVKDKIFGDVPQLEIDYGEIEYSFGNNMFDKFHITVAQSDELKYVYSWNYEFLGYTRDNESLTIDEESLGSMLVLDMLGADIYRYQEDELYYGDYLEANGYGLLKKGDEYTILTAPDGITNFDCSDLEDYNIKGLARGLFSDDNDLVYAEIPDDIQMIGSECFARCTNLVGVLFEEDEKIAIGERVFLDSSGLRFVAYNAQNVEYADPMYAVGGDAFVYCTESAYEEGVVPFEIRFYDMQMILFSFADRYYVEQSNDGYILYGTLEYDGETVDNVYRATKDISGELVIDKKLMGVEYKAFSNCSQLNLISIMDTIDWPSITRTGFLDCKKTLKINLRNPIELDSDVPMFESNTLNTINVIGITFVVPEEYRPNYIRVWGAILSNTDKDWADMTQTEKQRGARSACKLIGITYNESMISY